MALALVGAALSAVPAPPAQAQLNTVAVSVGAAFPSTVTVGAQNQPAILAIVNNSLGTVANLPVVLSMFTLNPSCLNTTSIVGSEPCTQPEPRPIPGQPIFNIDPIATGRAGTACTGILFAVSPPNANGTVTFTPTGPVVLGPSAVAVPRTKATAWVPPSIGLWMTSKVKSMVHWAAGPPVDDGPRTTGELGVKTTVPAASGGDTWKVVPAHPVPARPIATGSMDRMGNAGSGRGSG